VDPLLGGEEAFEALRDTLHGRGMRLVPDGVFNHCGRGFWFFHHLVENGADSPYRGWSLVERWPLAPTQAPKRRTAGIIADGMRPPCPSSAMLILLCATFCSRWAATGLERGIDGWRLDVPNEVAGLSSAEW